LKEYVLVSSEQHFIISYIKDKNDIIIFQP
jgi:hypothetical protein